MSTLPRVRGRCHYMGEAVTISGWPEKQDSEAGHDVSNVVEDPGKRFFRASVHLLSDGRQTQERTQGTERRVEQHGETSGHRYLALVLSQSLPDGAQRFAQELQVGGHVNWADAEGSRALARRSHGPGILLGRNQRRGRGHSCRSGGNFCGSA